jgi:hypothetical protein
VATPWGAMRVSAGWEGESLRANYRVLPMMVGQELLSRYSRSEDGHPSPSPARKSLNYGQEHPSHTRRSACLSDTPHAVLGVEQRRRVTEERLWLHRRCRHRRGASC